ncbi:MAG: sugar transferase [Bryobacterales bacterium]|nr:sugar transferase [Bryobacterales bacterium]
MIRLLRSLIPPHILTLLVTETALMVCSFVLACYLILDVDPAVYLLYDGGAARVGLISLTLLVGIYLHDLYSEVQVRSRVLLVQQGLQIVGVAILAQALFGYVSPGLILPRWVVVLGSGLSLLCFVSWRIFYSAVMLRAIGEERVLFLGANALAVEIAGHLAAHPEFGMRVLGFVDGGGYNVPPAALERLGEASELKEVVAKTGPDRIIVAVGERRGGVPLMDLLDLRFSGLRIEEAAATFERVMKRVSLNELRPAQLIYSGELGPRRSRLALQFAYSGLLALAAVLVLSPLMLLVALVVRFSSGAPILYRQTRVGWQGRVFTLYKFRSMRQDAEAATGAIWAAREDPRVTPVGRWLRRLRLDELPQLFNVLRGDMSLVGPRPERPEFVGQLSERIPYYRQRHWVRPGITGWAQINHKYGDTLEDAATKLEYDLYYIKHLSPALDFFVLFHTLKTVILSRGAQ